MISSTIKIWKQAKTEISRLAIIIKTSTPKKTLTYMANKGGVHQRSKRVSRQSQSSRQCNRQYLQHKFITLKNPITAKNSQIVSWIRPQKENQNCQQIINKNSIFIRQKTSSRDMRGYLKRRSWIENESKNEDPEGGSGRGLSSRLIAELGLVSSDKLCSEVFELLGCVDLSARRRQEKLGHLMGVRDFDGGLAWSELQNHRSRCEALHAIAGASELREGTWNESVKMLKKKFLF